MHKLTISLVALTAALGAAACSNPADGKPKAKVEEAKPVPGPAASPGAGAGSAATNPSPAPAPATGAGKFSIAPDSSKIAITASKPTKTHQIKVNAFTGSIDIADLAKPEGAVVVVEIDAKSIEADEAGLTKHLLAKDFFWTEKYPVIKFQSTGITAGGDKGATHTITGNLDMRGVNKSVTFPATVSVAGDKVTLKTEFVINRRTWGIEYPGMADDLIRDEVVIKLDVNAPVAK